MASAGKKKTTFGAIVIALIIAFIKWKYPHLLDQNSSASSPSSSQDSRQSGEFQVYSNCTLVDFRNNDGDSFMVKLPGGRDKELRLYFVDTPESKVKTYRDGNSNLKRIQDQAKYFGGISVDEATEIGQRAKNFAKKRLSKPFEVYTTGEAVYGSGRDYAFVKVDGRWFHELVVEEGLGRIHTKPATMPDKTAASRQRDHLKKLEKAAKGARKGAWGL